MRRFVESGRVEWTTVPAEPFGTLAERFEDAARAKDWDLAFASHVFYSSGHVFDEVFEILYQLPESTISVVDGYHGFFALPTDLGPWADRVFYTSGGYKYAMSGEGVSFLVAPHTHLERPEITGWFAGFSSMKAAQSDRVGYDEGAARFLGATLEPTPFYRLNAVADLMDREGLTIDALHAHSIALQERFLEHVEAERAGELRLADLIPAHGELPEARRGNFLTFRRLDAQALHEQLLENRIVTDVRDDRLRFGFGLYHRPDDVDALAERLGRLS